MTHVAGGGGGESTSIQRFHAITTSVVAMARTKLTLALDVRLTKSLLREIKAAAKLAGLTKSSLVRLAVSEWLLRRRGRR